MAEATEAEEEGEEEKETSLVQKGRKSTTPRKRKQVAPGSTSTPKKIKVYSHEASKFPSSILEVLEYLG